MYAIEGAHGFRHERASVASNPESSKSEKQTTAAAKEFESVMLNQWLQAAESSFGATPDGDGDEDQGGQQMKSLGVQQLAAQLTARGGIGIAKLVQQGLIRAGQGHASPTGTLRSNP